MKRYLLNPIIIPIFSIFLSVCVASAQNLDLKKAAKSLSTKNVKAQEKAEAQLKARGYDALKHVVPLMYSNNKTTEKRARRIYAWIMFGLNESIPKEICEQFYRFNMLSEKEKLKLIDQYSRLKTKQPFTSAALHSRVLEILPQSKKLEEKTRLVLTLHLSHKNFKSAEFDPRLLHLKTRGIVMSDIAMLGRSPEMQKVYETWLKLDPKMRTHLVSSGVFFELKRLENVKNPRKELEFYSVLQSPPAKKILKTKLANQWKTKRPFKLSALTEQEAIAYLEVSYRSDNEAELMKDYKAIHARFPHIAEKLPMELRVLGILELLDSKQFYPAFELAVKTQMQEERSINVWLKLGTWAKANPDALKDGLPPVPEKIARHLKQFLYGLVPMKSGESAEARLASVKLLSGFLQRSKADIANEWMTSMRQYHVSHFIWVSGIRGKLDSVMSDYEKSGQQSSLYTVGRAMSNHVDFCHQVIAKNHPRSSMEILANSIWIGPNSGFETLKQCDAIILKWEKDHPELLKKSKRSGAKLFLAKRLWEQGNQLEAIQQLTVKENYDYRGSWLLIQLLRTTPTANTKALLNKAEAPERFLDAMIKHYLDAKEVKAAEARQLNQVWSLNLERGVTLSSSRSYLARKYAYQLWCKGHTEEAYGIMQLAFWDDSDKKERYMSSFPEMALTLGKTEQAIAYGDTLKMNRAKLRHALKMAYLYRASGNLKQARSHAENFPTSKLRVELAFVNQDWDDAQQSLSLICKKNAQRLLALEAWYAYLKGDLEKAKNAYAKIKKPNKWMMLTVSDNPLDRVKSSMRVNRHLAEQKLKKMALDLQVIAISEKAIRESLKTKQPVIFSEMTHYLDYAKSLPNQKNASELIYQVGLEPICMIRIATDAENKHWAHKTKAIKALTLMGKTELRNKLLEHTLGKNKDLSEIPWFARTTLFQSVFPTFNWFPDALIKTLQLETPDLSGDKRILLLEKLFQQQDRVANVVKFIEVAQRHQEKLTKLEQADIVNFCSLYLGHKTRVRTKLELVKGNMFDEVKLEFKASERLSKSKDNKRSIKTNAKLHHNPRSKEFVLQNGIAHALVLWNSGEKEAAKQQINAITIRVLLSDEDSKKLVIYSTRGRLTSSYQAEEMALICYRILELPVELLGNSPDSLMRKSAFYNVDEKFHWAAEIAEFHGDFPKALACYHLYTNKIMFHSYGDFTEIINRLHALETICAAQKGNTKKVIFHTQQRLKVKPYEMTLLPQTLKILNQKGDTETIKAIDTVISTFWQQKLTELPDHEPYKQALKDWQAIMK